MTTPFSPESLDREDRGWISQRVPCPGAVAGTVLRAARLSANLSTSRLAESAEVPEASVLAWEAGTAAVAAVPSPVVERLEAALRAAGAEPRLVADLAVGAWCDLVIITIAAGEEADCLLADPLAAADAFRELLTWAVADESPARYRRSAAPRRLLPAADLNLLAGIVQALEAVRPRPGPPAGPCS